MLLHLSTWADLPFFRVHLEGGKKFLLIPDTKIMKSFFPAWLLLLLLLLSSSPPSSSFSSDAVRRSVLENNPFRIRDLFKAELEIRGLMEELRDQLEPGNAMEDEVTW